MSILTSLLIVAAIAAPTSTDRHVDAVEIFHCDFSNTWDVNFDNWPDGWKRKEGPDWPKYVDIHIGDDESAVAGRSLQLKMNGASAHFSSPMISVSEKFSYVLETHIATEQLEHGRVRVQLNFCDEQRNIVQTVPSRWFQNTNGWQKIHLGPVNVVQEQIHLVSISLVAERGDQVDLDAEIRLDDVWLARIPRMVVHTNSSFNVYTNPDDIRVTCELSGIQEKDPYIRFELFDASSHRIDDSTIQMEGKLINERVSKASDIINTSKRKSLTRGYEGKTTWNPPIEAFGFYRVRVSMQTVKGTLKQHVISIAVVPPMDVETHGEFGWSFAGDDIPLSFDQLESLLPRVAVSWVKLPVWYGESEPEKVDQLIRFTERLAAKEIEVVGVVDQPPEDLNLGRVSPEESAIADLLISSETSSWLPSLDAVLTRLSLRVRWWQLGSDRDTSFAAFRSVNQQLRALREKLFRFGQEVNLGIGWPWNMQLSLRGDASWDFQQFSAVPMLTGKEIAAYLQRPNESGLLRWTLIEPLDRREYDLETRTRDLVEQILASKIHGADGIFLAQPFDDYRGLMSDAGTPGDLLLPWRTTASLLGGTEYLGTMQLPGGSQNWIFETDEGEVLMVVWDHHPRREKMYFGEDVRIVDVWGRTEIPESDELQQIIDVETMPRFVLGLNPQVTKWRMNTHFVHNRIPSVFGIAHANRLQLANPFPQGAGGSAEVRVPEGWQVLPYKMDFKLSAHEKASRPFEIVLPFDANSGEVQVRVDYEFTADRPYRFSVYRALHVGDEYIDVQLHTRLDEDGSLIVEQRMINLSPEPVDFKCLLYAPGRRRQRLQVFQLKNSHDIQTYVFQNGYELIGQEIRLSCEELGGTRVLNYTVTVEE